MMAQELVTAVQENVKLTVVLVNNHGFASIGGAVGVGRGAAVWHVVPVQGPGHGPPRRRPPTARLCGERQEPRGDGLSSSHRRRVEVSARRRQVGDGTGTGGDRDRPGWSPPPSSESWWDVAVAEVSDLDNAVQARKSYEVNKVHQRRYL